MSAEASGLVPGDHPDRIKWNAKYGAGFVPSFRPHPLAVRALALDLPDGPVADLACGPSGAALLAAEQGRRVTAVDVSEVALGLLGDEARQRGLGRGGRRPAGLGGLYRRRPPDASRPAARVVPSAGRARVPPAARLLRAGSGRGARPRPPPDASSEITRVVPWRVPASGATAVTALVIA